MNGQNQAVKPGAFSRWRPTRELVGADYVGNQVCLQCHKEKASIESANAMAHAAESGRDCASLKAYQDLTFTNGPYAYRFLREGKRNLYVVSDGQQELKAPILFCFGQGRIGQTYILEYDGKLYESRVSYFRQIGKLDFTILHPHSPPVSLVEALGRQLTPDAASGCFSCHTTGAVRNGQLQIDQMVPGVRCEACHGPGEKHAAAMKARDMRDLKIFPPAHIDSEVLTQEVCGACHRSFENVLSLPGQDGINNIRYQPYRIFNSPGHRGDPRISCMACHDPHDRLTQDVNFYDSKCLACHVTKTERARSTDRSAPPCPTADNRCVTCHMQKIDLPGAHGTFTDHWIRVVRSGQPIPR